MLLFFEIEIYPLFANLFEFILCTLYLVFPGKGFEVVIESFLVLPILTACLVKLGVVVGDDLIECVNGILSVFERSRFILCHCGI